MHTLKAIPLLLFGCADPCLESGAVCTVAGTGAPGSNPAETDPTLSPLYGPMDVTAVDGPERFFIGDWNNHKIREVADGDMRTVVGTSFLGDGDPTFQERIAPGVDGTEVALNHPTQTEWNPVTGRLLIPSWHNHRLREWDPATGLSLVVGADTDINDGNGANLGFAGDGGPAADALMGFPNSIAVDPADGSFWFVDQKNQRIRWVAADFSLIDTVAGDGASAHSGDGGDPLEASFNFWDPEDLQPEPSGAVEYDGESRLFIADTSNHAIRVIDLSAGIIETLVGGDQSLPGGACDADTLCFPRDVEWGPDGQLYVADEANHVIRRIDPDTGDMETVVGTFASGDAEEGTPALEAALNWPYGLDITDDGTLLIADTYNHRIRKVTP